MARKEQISVRIPVDLARKLDDAARARSADRSEVIRAALRLYLEGLPEPERPWDRIEHLAGVARGGPADLGARHRKHLVDMLDGARDD